MYQNDRYAGSFERQQMNGPSMGYVRVLHAVPDAPNVDVYANDQQIAKNLAFGEITPYMPLKPGNYIIRLYAAGTKDSPLLTNSMTVNRDSSATIAVAGTLDDMGFILFPDSEMSMEQGKAMVRFVHLSPDAPAVDVALPNGTVLFEDVAFKQRTPYLSVPPMKYTLQVSPTGMPEAVVAAPNVNLESNKLYTVYAIGFADQEPELQALLLTDK